MIRVGMVATSFPDASHNFIWAWLQRMRSEGIEFTILTENLNTSTRDNPYFNDPELWQRIVLLNHTRHKRNWITTNLRGNLSALRKPERLSKLSQQLTAYRFEGKRKAIRMIEYLPWLNSNFDIVHFNFSRIAARRLEIGEVLGNKTLVSFRGQDLTLSPGFFDQIFSEADHMHFISQHLLDEARAQGYRGEKHSLIPPMVDIDFYTPAPEEKKPKTKRDKFSLLTCARLFWVKGWEFALKAVELLVKQGWDIEYTIAGDGEFRDAVVYTIHELGLEERVHLLGWQNPHEVKHLMQQADLYLLASVNEGFNNSVLQAQACGLAVVCSDSGGLRENVVDGWSGRIAKRRDAWDLAEKMQSLLEQPELLLEMGRNGRARAVNDFSLDKISHDFVLLYRQLAGTGSP